MKTNTPNPLVPQGTFPDARGKSHIRIAVFTILAVHMVLIAALLMAGCKKTADPGADANNTVTPPSFDTSSFPPPGTSAPPSTTTSSMDTTMVPPPPTPGTTAPPEVVVPPPVPPVPPPGPSTGSGLAPSGVSREYVVAKGDSFYTIAKKMGVTSKAIAAANPGVDSTKLKIGQKLNIPAASATLTASAPSAVTAESATVHVVKSGETLSSISKAEGVTVKALRAANNLKTTQIKVGQKLKIPSKPATPTAPEPLAPITPVTAPSVSTPTSGPTGTAPLAP